MAWAYGHYEVIRHKPEKPCKNDVFTLGIQHGNSYLSDALRRLWHTNR